MAQPKTLHTWATDATFTAPGKPWDGTPPRVTPNSGLAEAGFAPEGEAYAPILNELFGGILDHLRALVDIAAVSFPERISGGSLGFFGATPRVASVCGVNSAMPAEKQTFLVFAAQTGGVPLTADRLIIRSQDGVNWTVGTNSALGSDPSITALAGHPTYAQFGLVVIDSTSGLASRSSNGGESWFAAGNLPTTGNWTALGVTPWLGLDGPGPDRTWIAVGVNKIATSTTLSGSWTSRVVPGIFSGATPQKIAFSPTDPDTCVILPTAGSVIAVSTNAGATWTAVDFGVSASWKDVMFSVEHDTWLILGGGKLYSAATPLGPWVERASPGSGWSNMAAYGRNIILVGRGEIGNVWGDTAVTSDFTNWTVFQNMAMGDAEHGVPRLVQHLDKIYIIRPRELTTGQYGFDGVASLRLPAVLRSVTP